MADIRCKNIDCSVLRDKVKNGLSAKDIQALGGSGSPQVKATEDKLRELLRACCAVEAPFGGPAPPPRPPGGSGGVVAAGTVAAPAIAKTLGALTAEELLAITGWGLVLLMAGAMLWDLTHGGRYRLPRWHGCDFWYDDGAYCYYHCPDGHVYFHKKTWRGCKRMEQFEY